MLTILRALIITVLLLPGWVLAAELPGLGDPGKLTAIAIEQTKANTLRGPEARRQLVVTGRYDSGQVRDHTQKVTWQATPASVAKVSPTGIVQPLADGTATITARGPAGLMAKVELTVTGIAQEEPVNFPNQIVPIFTKLSCNAGNCHGKSGGQNGFSLSLLGFAPRDDHRRIAEEQLGRRVSPALPDRSLLLTKSIADIPHGGGQKLEKNSPSYRLIRRWIAQGMPYGDPEDRKVMKLEVHPEPRQMQRGTTQQLSVTAIYPDGSREDVTTLARYESNSGDIARVDETGRLTIDQGTGTLAVMVRYQGRVGVFRGTAPLGLPVTSVPPVKNFIDELAAKQFKLLGLPPSGLCDDATFLRRATIDIAGRLPTMDEAKKFLANTSPRKREQLIDHLLEDPGYVEYFAKKWGALLRNKPPAGEKSGARFLAFNAWIRDRLRRNLPFDQFVRDVVASSGTVSDNPPVAWYYQFAPNALLGGTGLSGRMEDVAQMFLGTRVSCAKCHHHPFESLSQADYYSFLAFFSTVRKKKTLPDRQFGDAQRTTNNRVYHDRKPPQLNHPRTREQLTPAGLDGTPVAVSPETDPRHALVDWMIHPDNPYFSRTLANRYWKHFFGRGLVEPEDDMRTTNPPTNPELLNALAKHFVESRYDLKKMIRIITTSSLYQLSPTPTAANRGDRQNYSHFYTRRLNAEVLLDAIDDLTGTRTEFSGLGLPGIPVRAVHLPHSGISNSFLNVFGMPTGESACECERSSSVSLNQHLNLINSAFILDKTKDKAGRAARLAAGEIDLEKKIEELYLTAFARRPLPDEVTVIKSHVNAKTDKAKAFADIIWALVNTKEFSFNH